LPLPPLPAQVAGWPGDLLSGVFPEHAMFQEYWQMARSDGFMPPEHVLRMRRGKSN